MRIRCYLTLLIISAFSLNAQERITSFTSTVVVHTDGTMHVQETIQVISTGKTIVHGIVREFPTTYTKYNLFNYIVDFDVQSITKDNNPVPFRVETIANGKKVYIGDEKHELPIGRHTYIITYTTNRQLGFFENHDELYWNITGNGWRLPIDKVQTSIELPPQIPSSEITAYGYTGLQGQKKQNYTYTINNNSISFSTTHPLQPEEGFTIVITWPKGFVDKPTKEQEWWWFFKDNIYILGGILIFFLLFFLILYVYIIARRKNKPGTIIPIFYPPKDFTPSLVGFMKMRQFNNILLAADIVHLAVQGFITISCQPAKFFSADTYTLTLIKRPPKKDDLFSRYTAALLTILFDKSSSLIEPKTLIITENNAKTIDAALKKVNKYCHQQTTTYITTLNYILYVGYALCIVWFIGATLNIWYIHVKLYATFTVFLFMIAQKIERFYKIYTPEGRKIQDQIDGFELYLTTAEIERMKIIGTPPTKTPELYEHYLPYAIALGVEQQWTEQFASIFATLAQQGNPYTPLWYVGGPFRINAFASNIGSSFNQAISSSSKAPGSSSGSEGGGSSGGGGGGGGGGGW